MLDAMICTKVVYMFFCLAPGILGPRQCVYNKTRRLVLSAIYYVELLPYAVLLLYVVV